MGCLSTNTNTSQYWCLANLPVLFRTSKWPTSLPYLNVLNRQSEWCWKRRSLRENHISVQSLKSVERVWENTSQEINLPAKNNAWYVLMPWSSPNGGKSSESNNFSFTICSWIVIEEVVQYFAFTRFLCVLNSGTVFMRHPFRRYYLWWSLLLFFFNINETITRQFIDLRFLRMWNSGDRQQEIDCIYLSYCYLGIRKLDCCFIVEFVNNLDTIGCSKLHVFLSLEMHC